MYPLIDIRWNRTFNQPALYQISILGRLGSEWALTFDGMIQSVEVQENGEVTTVLRGVVIDQSALYGLLDQIRDFGLFLLSVERLE